MIEKLMEYHTTIKIDDTIKNIVLKPALYMDAPLWEITLEEKNYILRKGSRGWEQSCQGNLNTRILNEIGNAIDSLNLREAG